jgi:cytochrome c
MTNGWRSGRSWCGVVLLVLAAVWLLAQGNGQAQERPVPSPDKGYDLAQKFCKSCHLVDDRADATLPAGIPTFRGIANRPGQTGQRIVSVLIKPHAPMPDISLSSEEMLNIIAYLETLRIDQTIRPLLETVPPAVKPQYPSRS